MTIRFVVSEDTSAPFYLRLADAIERAIVDGAVAPGEKLPPQRDIAYDLGVTVGTISRAYQIARERGLTAGEVGRGTYVRNQSSPAAVSGRQPAEPQIGKAFSSAGGNIPLDSSSAADIGQSSKINHTIESVVDECSPKVLDYVRRVPPSWGEAGAEWLATGGWKPEPDNVVATSGADAALQAVIGAMTHPGDRIVFENLTYSAVARAATMIGRLPLAVGMDKEGMIPDELDRCAARQHPRLIFVMPAANNPTACRMSLKRRQEIVAVARRHNLTILEDNVYGELTDPKDPPIAALAPERTFLVGGLSKSVAAGVRGGWVACPRGQSVRVTLAHGMLAGSRSFLNMEVAARLVLSGQASAIRAAVIAEIMVRGGIFDDIFERETPKHAAALPFRWLTLPEPWTSPAFHLAALNHSISIVGEDEFRPVRPDKSDHCVRIALSAASDREVLSSALTTLKGLYDSGSVSYESLA